MKLVVNGQEYHLHGYLDSSQYTIIDHLASEYYLCKDADGNEFALYIPDLEDCPY